MRLLSALVLVPGVVVAQDAWRDPFVLLQEAQAAVSRGDLPAARRSLDALAAQQLTPPGFFSLYGFVLFNVGDLPAAQAAFTEALKEEPDDATALFYTGLIYLEQDKKPEANAALQKAQRALPETHALRPTIDALLQGLAEPPPPKRLHALAALSTQADSNAQLTPEDAASDAAGARVLVQLAGSFAQPITKTVSVEASGGGLLSIPFVNAETLRAVDPSLAYTSLSLETKSAERAVLGGVSLTGKLYGINTFQELFLEEGSALLLAQVGATRSARLAYRATLSNFVLSEEAEGTSFDQDCFQQEGALSLRSAWGGLASFLYAQAEADGNSFDRRSFMLQAGIERSVKRFELRASADGGVVLFPNGDAPRQDLRASFAAQASALLGGVSVYLSYQGSWSDSTDEDFSYVRHLVTLGTRWQR